MNNTDDVWVTVCEDNKKENNLFLWIDRLFSGYFMFLCNTNTLCRKCDASIISDN